MTATAAPSASDTADATRAAWSAAHAAWAAVSATDHATWAAGMLSAFTIVVAVGAIIFSNHLQNEARSQRLGAGGIGIAHALLIYLQLVEVLQNAPAAQRADCRKLLNMCKPARIALAQVLRNSIDDTDLYSFGVNLQTALIVFEDEAAYASGGQTTNTSNGYLLNMLTTLVPDYGEMDQELFTIRKRLDKQFRKSQARIAAALNKKL